MAILKIQREDTAIEVELPIYEHGVSNTNKTTYSNHYQISNGIITQTMEIDLYVGVQRVNYPITYNTACQGVFVDKVQDGLRDKICIYDIQLDHCYVKVLPYDSKDISHAVLVSTGY